MAWRSTAALVCLLGGIVGCEDTGGDGGGFDTSSTPAPKKSGGFSAGLKKDLDEKNGGKAGDTKVADSDVKAGDSKAGDSKAGDTKAGDTKAGDTKAGDTKAGDTKAGDTKAGDTNTKAGDTKPADTKPGDTKAGDPKPGVADVKPTVSGPPPINTGAPRVAVKPSAELAAIKLSLSPNWDRDVGEAGTISLVVKVPGTSNTQVFAFRYGYEDPKAPTDREAYKKWLANSGILTPTLDRQRGGSWYLEGTDGSGAAAFRIVVVYGGRKLICGGSLYKDAAGNALGDIRDKTITQAKEICESVSL